MIVGFHPDSHNNKFGYYSTGPFKTYSKYEALKLGQQFQTPVQWHFNDLEYAAFDWGHEPQESINEIYRRRAQQIRDKYDYLVLFYSGGADSHNVLMTFAENGIHLDEVVQFTTLEGDRDPDSYMHAELTRVAMPTTQKIIQQYNMRTRHREIDVSRVIYDMKSVIDDEEWAYSLNVWLSPINMARGMIREYVRDYQELFSQGKRVCFVWGQDKPRIAGLKHRETGEYHYGISYPDQMDWITQRQKRLNRSWELDEFFYWTPDMPEITCKQGHLISRFLKQAPVTDPYLWINWEGTSSLGHKWHGNKKLNLNRDVAHSLIYPHWDPATFSVGKTKNGVFSGKDRWLWKHAHEFDTVSMFVGVVKKLQVLPQWQGYRKGLKSMWSPVYPLAPNIDLADYDIIWP